MHDFENKTSFDINDIIKILPHRYPFILIDKKGLESLSEGLAVK